MGIAQELSENGGLLRYFAAGGDPGSVAVEQPPADVDTWRLGAHPDIVERLWTHLNAALPADSRSLIAGGAALVDPSSGLVLAVALGTQYAIRLTEEGLAAALAAGLETRHEFATVGRTLDLAATFGPGWVFGRYDEREAGWLAESAATFGTAGSGEGIAG
jgi:hypothetical protein